MDKHLLRDFVWTVVEENSYNLPSRWYHGSPYSGMETSKDYVGKYMFLTDSFQVAKEYTRSNPGLQAGRKPKNVNSEHFPTIYEVILNFGNEEIFDLRKPAHQDLFRQLSKESLLDDPEAGFRKSDVIAVHPAQGSKLAGVFPSFGIQLDLMPRLEKLGYLACFFA